jgi:hypothetical protein
MTKSEILNLPDGFHDVLLEGNQLSMEIRQGKERKVWFNEMCDTIYLNLKDTTESILVIEAGVCGVRFTKCIEEHLLTLIKP